MAWYRTGTITVTNGSTTVTGSGTLWIANAGIGEALYAPDGRLYEITNIASDTSITIAPAYLGAGASAQAYTFVPSQSYIRDLAAQAADLVNNYSTIYNTVGQGKFADGTISAPGIRYSDDLDTGFFRSASNEVTFVAGGVAIFKYNASGVSFTTGGTLVGTTSTQTLTNKTISADDNTLSGIAASSFVLSNASGNIDGAAAQKVIPAGLVVGTTDTQTLTNKTINLTSNTLVATSAQLAAAVTDETGTGALVFAGSPALTGTPTAPTAAVGTNTTQLATTAHVFAERAATATLTNKTITGGTVNPTTLQEGSSPAVIQTDIGTAPNEIPLNQYLGNLAFMNSDQLVLNPVASAVPSGIGDMVFQLSSDTSLVVKVKGSDGTIRTATLTLA
jgi:hypothetical protein